MDLAVTRGLRLVEHRPRQALPPPGAHPRRPRHRRQHLLDGLRQPRPRLRHRRRLHPRPGQRPPGRLRRLPAERAGRGRRRRHPQHRAARRAGADRQDVVRPADADHGDAGDALQGPVRHRVHHRARQAVDAADPGRQAHRRRRLPHRHPARRPGPDRRGRGAPAGQRRPARAADVPALRRRRRQAPSSSAGASPPRRARPSARRSSTRTPPSSGRAPARRSSSSAARPTPTTSTA